jgi:hypothetical protein
MVSVAVGVVTREHSAATAFVPVAVGELIIKILTCKVIAEAYSNCSYVTYSRTDIITKSNHLLFHVLYMKCNSCSQRSMNIRMAIHELIAKT